MLKRARATHLKRLILMKGGPIGVRIISHAGSNKYGTSGISFLKDLRDMAFTGAIRMRTRLTGGMLTVLKEFKGDDALVFSEFNEGVEFVEFETDPVDSLFLLHVSKVVTILVIGMGKII